MPFPSVEHQFKVGNPGGPGRPRKHPRKTRGVPWDQYRAEGADVEALAEVWAAQIVEGQPTAVYRFVALADRVRDELDFRML